jgi:hypothetical protein
MSYPLLMHHLETFEYLLANILNGSCGSGVPMMLGKIAFLEIFHCNIQSLGVLEPSKELHK